MDRPDSPSPQPGASPIKAFLIIFALIILTTAIFLMTANGEETTDATRSPSTNSTPDFSLTDEEAIARFNELKQVLYQAIERRDSTVVPLATTEDGHTHDRAIREIRSLTRDGVFDRTSIESKDLIVTRSSAQAIELVETIRIRACFVNEAGDDVTKADALVEQTSKWTMLFVGSEWLLDDAVLIQEEVLDDKAARCA